MSFFGANVGMFSMAYPTITSLNVSNGPTSGGTNLSVTGFNFQPGITATIGDNPMIGVSWVSANNFTGFTPAGTSGAKILVATNPNGHSGSYFYFTYDSVPVSTPTVTSISPDRGEASGGTFVTITGTGFTNPPYQAAIGGTTITSLTWVDAQTLTGYTQGTAATCPTPYLDIDVFNSDLGHGHLTGAPGEPPDGFFYYRQCTASSIDPTEGDVSGGTFVTVTGTNFVGGGYEKISINGVQCTGVTVVNSFTMTGYTGSTEFTGTFDVEIENGDANSFATIPAAFTYTTT